MQGEQVCAKAFRKARGIRKRGSGRRREVRRKQNIVQLNTGLGIECLHKILHTFSNTSARFSDVTRITPGSDRLEALEEMLLLLRLPMNKEVTRK